MKRYTIQIVLACLILPLLVGCSRVQLSAKYSTILDETAALSTTTAMQAEAGNLSQAQMVTALRKQAQTWEYFCQARDGKAE